MQKWSLALLTLGLLLIMMASQTQPANLLMVFSGLFYVAVALYLYFRAKKKEEGKKL